MSDERQVDFGRHGAAFLQVVPAAAELAGAEYGRLSGPRGEDRRGRPGSVKRSGANSDGPGGWPPGVPEWRPQQLRPVWNGQKKEENVVLDICNSIRFDSNSIRFRFDSIRFDSDYDSDPIRFDLISIRSDSIPIMIPIPIRFDSIFVPSAYARNIWSALAPGIQL